MAGKVKHPAPGKPAKSRAHASPGPPLRPEAFSLEERRPPRYPLLGKPVKKARCRRPLLVDRKLDFI